MPRAVTNAGGVEQQVGTAAEFAGNFERIACGAGDIADDGAVASEQGVGQRGFADVGASDDDDPRRNFGLGKGGLGFLRSESFAHRGKQVARAASVHRADPDHPVEPELQEFAFEIVMFRIVEFVHDEHDRARGAA